MKTFYMAASVGLFTLGGIWIADRYACRCIVLENMLRFCRSMRMQSALFARPLAQQCRQMTDMSPQMQPLLDEYVRRMQEGSSAQEAWRAAVEIHIARQRRRYGVTPDDLALFTQIGEAVHGFLPTQQEALRACESELERLLAQAQACRARYAALYAKLGLLAGIAAAILIW